jgi:hypothetical protein
VERVQKQRMQGPSSRKTGYPASRTIMQPDQRMCRIFFLFWYFLIIVLEMNLAKYFFSNMLFLSRANPSGVTYE